jgi:hypothetical protein
MPTPHVATRRRVSPKTPIPTLPVAEKTADVILSQPGSARIGEPVLDRDTRQRMICEAAYYRAEKRNFAPGGQLQDWLEAEAQISAWLSG